MPAKTRANQNQNLRHALPTTINKNGPGSESNHRHRAINQPLLQTLPGAQLTERLLNNLLGRQFNTHSNSLIIPGLFQRIELALQQRRIKEMPSTRLQTLLQHFPRTLEIDKANILIARAQNIAIRTLQRRTSKNRILMRRLFLLDRRANRPEPRPAIFIRQRNAVVHLLLVGSAMKRVAIREAALEPLRQHFANTGLAGARHAHRDQNHLKLLTGPPPMRRSNPSPSAK